MGLFDKKFCDVCGDKIGLLGNRKLEDGNLCKNCAKKLSPWFDERRHSTVEQIKKQLTYRENNRSCAAAFNISRSFGKGGHRLYVDDSARKFAVNRGSNFAYDNPDILDFSQAVGCDLNIDESRRELKRTVDGKSVSYNPPRYEYSYEFTVTIRVNHPYFDDMKFNLKGSSVDTGDRCMTGANTGGWTVNSVTSGISDRQSVNEYNELVQLGNEIKSMIDSWRNGGQQTFGNQQGFGAQGVNTVLAQIGTVRFGSLAPVPYTENINGMPLSLTLIFSGTAEVSVCNPLLVQNVGGIDGAQSFLQNDLTEAVNQAVAQCGNQGVSVAHLPARQMEISGEVKTALEGKWAAQYGIAVNSVSLNALTLTEESKALYNQVIMVQAQPDTQYQNPVQTITQDWICAYCGSHNSGKFCTSCGAKKE